MRRGKGGFLLRSAAGEKKDSKNRANGAPPIILYSLGGGRRPRQKEKDHYGDKRRKERRIVLISKDFLPRSRGGPKNSGKGKRAAREGGTLFRGRLYGPEKKGIREKGIPGAFIQRE